MDLNFKAAETSMEMHLELELLSMYHFFNLLSTYFWQYLISIVNTQKNESLQSML